nr:unnamed protein product [uncultured bacterium]
MQYVNYNYNQLTSEQHVYMLKKIVAYCIKYMDGETLKTVLLAQGDNYMLELINELQKEGALVG